MKTVANIPAEAAILTISVRGHKMTGSSFAEISAKWSALRDRSGEGASTWGSGIIRDASGDSVAMISYNGKVWPVEDWTVNTPCLFDPYAAQREQDRREYAAASIQGEFRVVA